MVLPTPFVLFYNAPPKSFLRLTVPAKSGTPGPRRFTALPG